MSVIKKPYEISVWEDKIVYVGLSGNEYNSMEELIAAQDTVEYQYYTEQRLATIGSNTMTSPMRVTNPVLTVNINGTETLKFSMCYQYIDNITGEMIHNPLIDLLVNERKVKLKYDNNDPNHPDGWYDFIIKKDEERARDYKYNFTCTSLSANELGKTGFKIELDTELENNMGTVQQLGKKVLEGSDWELATEGQSTLQQTVNEPLYKIRLGQGIEANLRVSSGTKVIESGKYIYVYYTCYAQQEKDYFQFIYIEDGATITTLTDGVTLVCDNENIWDLYLTNVTWDNNKPSFQDGAEVVSDYRGDRYVRKQKTTYNPVLARTVNIYEDGNGVEVHGYKTVRYIDTLTVSNYIHNSVGFGGSSYWAAYGGESSVSQIVYPSVNGSNVGDNRKSYLKVKLTNNSSLLMNDGIIYNYSKIDTFVKGETYILRMKVKGHRANNDSLSDYCNTANTFPFDCEVRKYTKIDQSQGTEYFQFNNSDVTSDGDYARIEATCTQNASWKDLKENLGIFFKKSNKYSSTYDYYYIEEVQLYKGIFADGHYLEIGEVPTVQFEERDYYYYPSQNIEVTSADDYKYVTNTGFIPVYGSGDEEFEKVRSISGKESNRFNLLQELCETFECWVRFRVYHELDGTITIEPKKTYLPFNPTTYAPDTYYIYDWSTGDYILATSATIDENQQYYLCVWRKQQKKEVIFYGQILEDNSIGFKYGINLKDVTRNLESDQIATKIIVKNNSCEYAENGFCSIARAKDNPTKENTLYNFDYYIQQGLLDRSTVYNDLYLKINGSIGLYPSLAQYNMERESLIEESAEKANSITNLTAQYQQAQLTYNAALEEKSKIIDPQSGKLYRLTGYTYPDFLNQIERAGRSGKKIPAYKNTIYYVKNKSGLTSINDGSGIEAYYVKIDFSHTYLGSDIPLADKEGGHFKGWAGVEYYEQKGNYYVRCGNNTIINNESVYVKLGKRNKTPYFMKGNDHLFTQASGSLAINGITYYWRCPTLSDSDMDGKNEYYFQTTNSISTIYFTYTGTPQVYIYNPYSRIDKASDDDTVNDASTINYLAQISTLNTQISDSDAEMNKFKTNLDETQKQYDDAQEKLKNIARATEEIEHEFLTKYSRYIQEGSWCDENYMDDDLYYLDAVNVLYQSAYPKVSYTVNVLELSALEGYEAYKFQVAHKTFIEDTEFFGWKDYAQRIPAREGVVVTELTTSLDEPDKNTIKVQNYKSHFEDLFQRITAATQNLEYHSGEYARAADAIQSNGTISQSVLQNTLSNAAYIISNSYNQSVVNDETGLQATNLTNPGEIVRLTSGGIIISIDGGQTWGTAISGYGINTDRLTSGVINTEKLNIMSGSYPTFKWDANGLRALAFTSQDGMVTNYDISRYTTFNQFGIYGINGITDFIPQTVSDVEKNSSFALTWNGLYIRTSYRDGYVSVSPSDDIAMYSYGSKDFNLIPYETYYVEAVITEEEFNSDKTDYYYISDDEYVQCDSESQFNIDETYYTQSTRTALEESYYYTNRPAFYILENGIYTKCTTETYDELPITLYIMGYELVSKPTSEEWSTITKTQYYFLNGGEYVQCTEDYPYEMLPDYVYKTSQGGSSGSVAVKRAKFGMLGRLNSGEELYGLALYNGEEEITVTTQSDGTLWLQDAMRIGTVDQTNTIYIGKGELVTDTTQGDDESKIGLYKVIRANDENNIQKFVLYSDGSLRASGAEITGTIDAVAGTIGGFLIEEHTIESSGLTLQSAYYDYEQILIDEETYNINPANYYIRYIAGTIEMPYNENETYYEYNGTLVPPYVEVVVPDEATYEANKENYYYYDNLKFQYIPCVQIEYGYNSCEGEPYDQSQDYYQLGLVNSKITVTNIDIGAGANITDYLQVGNLFISKPTEENNNKIFNLNVDEETYFYLDNNGKLYAKDGIFEGTINATAGTIGGNLISENGITITNGRFQILDENENPVLYNEDGNLIVKGTIYATDGEFTGIIHATDGDFTGTITASVIEAAKIITADFITEKVRCMGGSFIFKPTFEIQDISYNELTDKTIITLGETDYNQYLKDLEINNNDVIVGFSNGDGNPLKKKIIEKDDNNYTFSINGILSIDPLPNIVILFGKAGADVIIGINSDSNDAGGLLKQKSLVIEDFEFNNEQIIPTIKLLLGDLNESPIPRQNNENLGYGLYADNVYLHGSLVTELPGEGSALTYAGVNTIPTTIDGNFHEKIVFWAGASSYNQAAASPFYVTEKGSMYAKQGIFEGSVISDSLIARSVIQAAIIEGTGQSPSLKIYDTGADGGIGFYKKAQSNEDVDIETLRITNSGIYCYNSGNAIPIITFSEVSGSKIIFKPTRIELNDSTSIENNQIRNDNNGIEIISSSSTKVEIKPTNITNNSITIKNQYINDNSDITNTISYKMKDSYYCLFVDKEQKEE